MAKSLKDLHSDVLRVKESICFNETERRNELLALDLLFRSGYYKDEPKRRKKNGTSNRND